MESLLAPSLDVIRGIQNALPVGLTKPMLALSWLGEESFYILMISVVYFFRSPSLAVRLLAVLILSNYSNALLKWAFHGPRPFWLDMTLPAPTIETSYGVPSGHAQNAVAVWGYLALTFERGRRALFFGALGLAFLISFSRLYLAMHFPHDVLVGWVVGGVLLALVIRFQDNVTDFLLGLGTTKRGLVVLIAASILGAGAIAASSWIHGIVDPEVWTANAGVHGPNYIPDPKKGDTLATVIGLLYGLGLLALIRQTFDNKPEVWKGIVGFIVVTAGVIAVRMLLSVKGMDGGPEGQILRTVRYAAVSGWGFAIAPLILTRLGLLTSTKN